MHNLRLNNAWLIQHDFIASLPSLLWEGGGGGASQSTTRWQCCSTKEHVLTCWLVQQKERGIERRRETESRRWIFLLFM